MPFHDLNMFTENSSVKGNPAVTLKDRIKRTRWFLGKILYSSGVSLKAKKNLHEKLTVIMLNYKRPKNVKLIARQVLKCDFVDKLIISNNNPEININNYFCSPDKRITIINQPVQMKPRIRWEIAGKENSKYFILIDDDILIYPDQLKKLFILLIKEPEIPHGLFGTVQNDEMFANSNKIGIYHSQENIQVNIIHQIYAVTEVHVRKYLEYRAILKNSNPEVYQYLEKFGDDVVISHSGKCNPKIHNLGFIFECPSKYEKGIAQVKEPFFSLHRKEIYKAIGKIKEAGRYYKFYINPENHKHHIIHTKFMQSILGGDYIVCNNQDGGKISEEILENDSENTVWFFTNIYHDLHPRLKGKQIFIGHGTSFKPNMGKEKIDCFNNYFDIVFGYSYAAENHLMLKGLNMDKYAKIPYLTVFQIPDIPVRPNSILFTSTCFHHWDHYKNLIGILKNLDERLTGYLTIHPQTPKDIIDEIHLACKKNIININTQEELLEAYAFCEVVAGGSSSAIMPFFYLKKPVIFIRGYTTYPSSDNITWLDIRRSVNNKIFDMVLNESSKICHWEQFTFEFVKNAKYAESSRLIFYESNYNRQAAIEILRQSINQLFKR
jgi:hypothetical protein